MMTNQRYTGPERRISNRRTGRDRRGIYLSEPAIGDRRQMPTRRAFGGIISLDSSG